ncbi:MAG: hypothetical protein AAF936_10540 [Pseudomonadota bacterium]
MNSSASDSMETAGDSNDRHPDQRWRTMMQDGNAAFRGGDKDAALLLYMEGMAEADRLFQIAQSNTKPSESDPAPALVVAAFNIANIYAGRADYAEAKQIMNRVTTLLRVTIADETAPWQLRSSCLQHVNRALAYLLDHMRSAGDSDAEIAEEVSAVQRAANPRLKLAMVQHLH